MRSDAGVHPAGRAAGALTARRGATFLVSFLTCFALALSWAAATPLFGVPDEISHMVRAAGAARGDLSGDVVPAEEGRAYRAPAVLAPLGDPENLRGGVCFAGLSNQSPACMSFSPDRRDRRLMSTAAAYPPVYYLVVGWPSRLSQGIEGLYGMRVANAALFSALIALAISSIGSGRRWALAYVGLALAATPMTWFLAGSVNPSAAATSSAIAAWCGGYRLVHGEHESDFRRYAWRLGLPLCILLVLRRDSILWAGLLVIGLAVHLRREQVLPMLRSRHVLGWGAASLFCTLYAWSTGIRHGSSFVGEESGGSGSAALGHLSSYIKEMIGVLGWLDTPLPSGTYLLWYLVLGAVVLPALAFAPRRTVLAICFVVFSVAVAIVALGIQLFPYFQGRYALPAAAGIPLLAGLGIGARPLAAALPTKALTLGLALGALVEVTAYVQHLRRNALSGQTTWNLFGPTQWTPPAPLPVLIVFHLLALLALCWWWKVRSSDPIAAGPVAKESDIALANGL